MKTELTWEVAGTPHPDDIAAVDCGLEEFNRQAADLAAVQRFACLVRRPSGDVIAGAIGRTWGRACELQQLWVHEEYRNSGVGTRLVAMVERRAAECGCTLLYLDTFSFQAPDFYRKLGYSVACSFAGFPNGIVKYIMHKALEALPPSTADR